MLPQISLIPPQTSLDFANFHGIAWAVSELRQVQPKFSGLCKQSRKVLEKQKFAEFHPINPDITNQQVLPLNITDSTSIFPEFVKFHGIAWAVSELHQIHPNFSGLCKLSQNCMGRLRPSSDSAIILRNLHTFTELIGESPNFIKFNRTSPDFATFLRVAWDAFELHQIQHKF